MSVDGARVLPYAPGMNEGLLPRLFPAGWPGARTASGRLLLDNVPDASPWVAIATAETHRVLPRDQVEASAWDVACLWLGKTPGAWVAAGEGRLAITAPNAAELVLDHRRLQLASTRLQASTLLVSVPLRGKLSVMVDTPRHRALLCQEARAAFDGAAGEKVCPYPLIVESGRPIGLVRAAPPSERPWWKPWA